MGGGDLEGGGRIEEGGRRRLTKMVLEESGGGR